MLTPKVRDLEQRCHQAELAAARLAEDPEGHGFALGGSRLVESTLGFIGRKVLAFEVRGHRRPDRPSNPPFPGPEAVRRARESFSPRANTVRRGRESFSSPVNAVRRARESFSSRA